MTGPSAGQQRRTLETRKPRQTAPRWRRRKTPMVAQRAAETQALRARHLSEVAQWRSTGQQLNSSLAERARADVSTRTAHQWALLLANRADPDFLAKVAALQADEQAAIAARIAELQPTLTTQRVAVRRLLADKHARERMALQRKWKMRTGRPGPILPIDGFNQTVKAAWMRLLFHSTARRLTRRNFGVRLRWRRPMPGAAHRR